MPWICNPPKHWRVERAKNMFTKQNRPFEESDDVVTCFRGGIVTLRKNRRLTGYTESTQWSGYQGIKKGDLVIHVMDAFAGSIGVSDSDGKATPVYSACTAKIDLNNYYYAYLLCEMARAGYIQALYRGIRERSSDFRFEVFSRLYLPIPPRAEQDKIVRFLDWKVGAIDRLVAAKKKQIGLLGELSQYQIKSLLDKIDTKKKLTAVTTKIGSGKTPRGGAAVYIDDGVLFIRSQNVLHRELQISNASYISEETDESMRSTRVFKNDVLLNITGGSIGRSCVYTFDNHANVNQHVCIIRPNTEHILPAFLALYLSSPEGQVKVKSCQNEGNRESLTFVQIGEFEVPCPPLETQRRIAAALDAKTARLDKAAQNLSIEIALLAEYRARLISDAVTGKLDVRGGAAPEHGIVDESTGINDDAAESGGK